MSVSFEQFWLPCHAAIWWVVSFSKVVFCKAISAIAKADFLVTRRVCPTPPVLWLSQASPHRAMNMLIFLRNEETMINLGERRCHHNSNSNFFVCKVRSILFSLPTWLNLSPSHTHTLNLSAWLNLSASSLLSKNYETTCLVLHSLQGKRDFIWSVVPTGCRLNNTHPKVDFLFNLFARIV